MDEEFLAAWVGKLGRAWEDRDQQAAAALFSPAVVYRENPFALALHGRAAVEEYWRSEMADHTHVRCWFDVIAAAGSTGIAHWRTTLTRGGTGAQVALDGLIVVQFNPAGECCSLREWWHAQEG